MPIYNYTATDRTGKEVSGTYNDVGGVAILREELGKMGYVLLKARRARAPAKKRKKVKRSEIVSFTYQFAEMYSAGLAILKCLETLEEQAENEAFKDVLADIRQSVETGSSLKNAFAPYRHLFSDFFLGMIEAGESGGGLAIAIEMSAQYLEKRTALKQKVRAAFVYPILMGVICIIVVGGLLVFVVPIFSKLYKRLRVPLPGPTQVLVALSALIRGWWWAFPFVGVAVVLLLRRLLKDPNVRARWDAFKLRMPIFAKLNRMVVVSHFTRTFAMLVSVGVSLVEALNVASLVAHNHQMTEISKELQEAIQAGNPVGTSLKKHDLFPPMITQLAISGEEVGELATMLTKGADFLDRDIDRTIKALLTKLEPALTVIMGAIVGFILMAVYLPMFDYMRYLK